MLKEVTKREAIMAALDGQLAYKIVDPKTTAGIIGTMNLTEQIDKLINGSDCARFVADVPEPEPEPKAEDTAGEVPPRSQK